MAFLAGFGTVCVLLGLILLTDQAENWHKRRKPQPPVRRYYPEGCRDCGMEEPLDHYRRCVYCADLTMLRGGVRSVPPPKPGQPEPPADISDYTMERIRG